jgi:hypothetical protein
MTGKRIISLLIILSMVAGIIGSGHPLSKRVIRSCDVAEMEADQHSKPAALISPVEHHIVLSDAVPSNLHVTLPAPLLIFSIVWIVLISSAGRLLPIASRRIDSSPPFMAAEHRHTYLRISVLLI